MSFPITFIEDPLDLSGRKDPQGSLQFTSIVHAQIPLTEILSPTQEEQPYWTAFQEGGRIARVALADFYARALASLAKDHSIKHQDGHVILLLEPLDWISSSTSRSRRRKRAGTTTPFVLERTDIFCDSDSLHVYLRLFVYAEGQESVMVDNNSNIHHDQLEAVVRDQLARMFLDKTRLVEAMNYVATTVLQGRLRAQLKQRDLVAFIANGSILPRKSGASHAPMTSPPALPFAAPQDSPMKQTIDVDMGSLKPYLTATGSSAYQRCIDDNGSNGSDSTSSSTTIHISGMVVPRGITLIVGGGYHGKSTMLRCIAAGVYNKCPGDGREFCVTAVDAVTVRAEDGRHVNNCNISAFISNLPTPPGMTHSLDTTHFSTGEASGSTSQAANVVEAIEMGASALLVDEDVSAANFMARDGRMRAMVMDESITPLLYRVNGLYNSLGISSIVVVGGVGDWLDVPHQVILMDRYMCKDATAKAKSVSKQFSHGHVQYAGRGVVHRLEWEKSGTPMPRRPSDESCQRFDRKHASISLMEGMDAIMVHPLDDNVQSSGDELEDDYMDMSRCEQLMGKKPQLYGTGLCTLWLMELSQKHPSHGLVELLAKLDETLDESGLSACLATSDASVALHDSPHWKLLVESLGCAFRPRSFEVGQALTRLHGIRMEELPVADDDEEAAARAEEERKKQELLDMWNRRRANKLSN